MTRARLLGLGLCLAALGVFALHAWVEARVTERVTASLARNEKYAGTFDDVDVSLLRLSYTIENLRLVKRNGKVPVPFVIAPSVDYSLSWKSLLLHGRRSGTTVFRGATLNLVDGPSPDVRQGPLGIDWRDAMKRLFPARVNRIEIHDGIIHLRNFHTEPQVDVYLDQVEITASNLSWRRKPVTRVVDLHGSGVPMKTGVIRADFKLYPNSAKPSFDCELAIRDAQLAEWESLLRAYVGLDVQARAQVDGQLESRDGQLDGWVKPVLSDVSTTSSGGETAGENALESLRDALVGGAAAILEAPRDRPLAARIPISGTLHDPEGDYWAALRSLLANAFVAKLEPEPEERKAAQ